MIDKFDEIKARVLVNKHTRDDVLDLVEIVDNFENTLDEVVLYTLEEAEVQDED
jgi:hypothetical protein